MIDQNITADIMQNTDVTKRVVLRVCPNDCKSTLGTGDKPKPALTAIDNKMNNLTLNSSGISCVRITGHRAHVMLQPNLGKTLAIKMTPPKLSA